MQSVDSGVSNQIYSGSLNLYKACCWLVAQLSSILPCTLVSRHILSSYFSGNSRCAIQKPIKLYECSWSVIHHSICYDQPLFIPLYFRLSGHSYLCCSLHPDESYNMQALSHRWLSWTWVMNSYTPLSEICIGFLPYAGCCVHARVII